MRAVQAVIAQRLALPRALHRLVLQPAVLVTVRCKAAATSVMSPALAEQQHFDPAVAGLQPAALWKFFAELSQIPRPSKHETRCVFCLPLRHYV